MVRHAFRGVSTHGTSEKGRSVDQPNQLTLPLAEELLSAAVGRMGMHYIDPNAEGGHRCNYASSDGEEPSCGVGHVLHDFGWEMSVLVLMDEDSGVPASNLDEFSLLHELMLVTPSAATFLHHFQRKQDNGHTWGSALKYAREMMNL